MNRAGNVAKLMTYSRTDQRHEQVTSQDSCWRRAPVVCDGAAAVDLDAQFRTAFRQDPPASEERPDPREILEVFSLDCRVEGHPWQLSLHEDGELDGVGERRRVCSGEISRMKNPAKWEH